MRSTGEVMGIDKTYAKAYAKAAIAAGQKLPASGKVFVTVMDKDKDAVVPIAKKLKVWTHPCTGLPLSAWLICRDLPCSSRAVSLVADIAMETLSILCRGQHFSPASCSIAANDQWVVLMTVLCLCNLRS